jgi:hypothetical protein
LGTNASFKNNILPNQKIEVESRLKAFDSFGPLMMLVTIEQIEALAPDQSSLSAALKIKSTAWQVMAIDGAREFAWGECQGSGSTPYRVSLQLSDLGYKCTCPSRKFPCKHSLGLMLLLAKSQQSFASTQTPDWVKDWVARRRPGSGEKKQEQPKPGVSFDNAVRVELVKERDEKDEARAAQQRNRLRAQREQAILAGLDELDRWIEDSLARGLASFMGEAAQRCRTLAQRLVDAKAPALATALDALPSIIMALPEVMRNDALLEALGGYHLLAEAYRRQDALPENLRQDVRRLVGWSQERQALLDDTTALRVTTTWTVITTKVEVQPDKLRRIETWLLGVQGEAVVPAVLIDFVPVASAATGSTFISGDVFAGELVFYSSAAPLRAIVSSRENGEATAPELPALPIATALAHYDDCRTSQPWLQHWPMTLAHPAFTTLENAGIWIKHDSDAIEVAPQCRDAAIILTSVDVQSVTGLWDGRFFTPVLAETSIGRWLQ